jgi:hypothetical protein
MLILQAITLVANVPEDLDVFRIHRVNLIHHPTLVNLLFALVLLFGAAPPLVSHSMLF